MNAATATTTTTAAATTVGMKVDAALAALDGLSSPQLYAVIVLATVLVATILLGNAKPLDETVLAATASPTAVSTRSAAAASSLPAPPEPRWYIFKLVNYGVLAAFGASVLEFFWHCRRHHHEQEEGSTSVLRMLVVWCVCLIYFFGFFGVSIVHSEVVAAAAKDDKKNG